MYFKDLICKFDLRQVPEVKMQNDSKVRAQSSELLTILLIGSGRLAQHLQHWNSILPRPNRLLTWNRQESVELLQQKASKASITWLAISDSQIISFFEQHLTNFNAKTVHFSGALHDARIWCAHPLMSFPKDLFDQSTYKKIHFTVTGPKTLGAAMPGFENSFSFMSAEDKPLYHALCVVSGNFPQLLWGEALPKFQKLNIPEVAFNTYIQQITNNFIRLQLNALTGPLVRKDFATIEKNKSALKDSKLEKVYQSFAEEFTK